MPHDVGSLDELFVASKKKLGEPDDYFKKTISEEESCKLGEELIDWISKLEAFDIHKNNPLILERINELVEAGADVNYRNEYGETPLHYACYKSEDSVIKLLVDHGADVNAKTLKGVHPIHILNSLTVESLLFLIANGANVDAQDKYGATALHVSDFVPKTKILIGAGANLNLRNVEGCTPLMLAVSQKRYNIVEVLVDAGADVMVEDIHDQSALNYASDDPKMFAIVYKNVKDADK